MKSERLICAAGAFFIALACVQQSACAQTIGTNQYYTWGIDSSSLNIPDGSIITEATLTMQNVTCAGTGQNNTLYIHLLDNLAAGFLAGGNNTPGDNLANQGLLLTPVYSNLTQTPQDLTYTFSQLNDPSSWVWQRFSYPLTFGPAESTLTIDSSLVMELIDYAGSGASFGFGLDPESTEDFNFDNITLELTIDSFLQQAQQYTITFTTALIAPIDDKFINEGQTLIFNVAATAQDGSTLICSAQNLPAGATFDGSTFIWTPSYDQAGSYQVTFTANDGLLDDSQTVTITVNNVNRPPVLAAIGNKSINENTTLTFNTTATDPDGDAITYSAQNLPVGATFTNGTFNWTPTYNQAGAYQITFTAADSETTDSETITVTVNNVNRAPILTTIGDKFTDENSILTFNVNATDPDGDAVTYSAQNLPVGATFANGTFNWTPTYNQAGSYQITFTASDGQVADTETVTVTVNNINRSPVLDAIGDKSIDENTTLTFGVTATDADGDALTYSAQNLPAGATFDTGTFTWTPDSDQVGSYQITFAVTDGSLQDTQTITVTVNDVNVAPVLAPIGDKSINEKKVLTFTVSATDADGDTITYSAQNLPGDATFENNTFTWRPWYGEYGTYDVTFIASDGASQDSETITITVNQVKLASWYDKWLRHVGAL